MDGGKEARSSFSTTAESGLEVAEKPLSLGKKRLFLGNNAIHRNVVGQREDRGNGCETEADADDLRFLRQGRQRPIIVATSVAQAVAPSIKTDHWRNDDVRRHDGSALGRYWNIPDPPFQGILWAPAPENERPALLNHDRQSHLTAAGDDLLHKVTKIRLAAERPIGADHQTARNINLLADAGPHCLRCGASLLAWNCQTCLDQACALGLAPAHHVPPLLRIDALESRKAHIGRIDFMHHARRRGIAALLLRISRTTHDYSSLTPRPVGSDRYQAASVFRLWRA